MTAFNDLCAHADRHSQHVGLHANGGSLTVIRVTTQKGGRELASHRVTNSPTGIEAAAALVLKELKA